MGRASRLKKQRLAHSAEDEQEQKRKAWLEHVEREAHRIASATLGEHPGPPEVVQLAQQFEAIEDNLIRQVQKSNLAQAELPHVTCQKGCGMCCYVNRVIAYPFEAAATANALRSDRSNAEIDELKMRLEAYVEEAGPGPLRKRVPCPFLVEECCSIYEHRPSACRVTNSVDLSACQRRFEHPEVDAPVPQLLDQHRVVRPLLDGALRALSERSLDSKPVLFVEAVRRLLDDPSAEVSLESCRPLEMLSIVQR